MCLSHTGGARPLPNCLDLLLVHPDTISVYIVAKKDNLWCHESAFAQVDVEAVLMGHIKHLA